MKRGWRECLFGRFRRGQTMTEYAIIVALIALVCIGAITMLGENIRDVFGGAAEELSGTSN